MSASTLAWWGAPLQWYSYSPVGPIQASRNIHLINYYPVMPIRTLNLERVVSLSFAEVEVNGMWGLVHVDIQTALPMILYMHVKYHSTGNSQDIRRR
jgi:hypothetical protein